MAVLVYCEYFASMLNFITTIIKLHRISAKTTCQLDDITTISTLNIGGYVEFVLVSGISPVSMSVLHHLIKFIGLSSISWPVCFCNKIRSSIDRACRGFIPDFITVGELILRQYCYNMGSQGLGTEQLKCGGNCVTTTVFLNIYCNV